MRPVARGAAILLMLAAGCGAPSDGASAGRTGSTATPILSSGSPSTAMCRLPVSWLVSDSSGIYTRHAALITAPAGTLVEDPTGLLQYQSLASTGRAVWRTAATPWLYGQAPGDYFDRPQSRWVPALESALSPDGARYAYSEGGYQGGSPPTIHVVDIATGQDRVVHSAGTSGGGLDPLAGVLGFANQGLYLISGTSPGIWLQDLNGSPPTLVVPDLNTWTAAASGGAFGVDLDATDPSPARNGIDGSANSNRLVRADLKTGLLTPWFTWPGAAVQIDGVDVSGAVWVKAFAGTNGSFQEYVVTGPRDATLIFTGSMQDLTQPGAPAQFDSYGAWFTSSDGTFWLYSKDGGMRKVMQIVRLAGVDFRLGGACA